MNKKIFYVFYMNEYGNLDQLSIALDNKEKAEDFCKAYPHKTTYLFELVKVNEK